MRGFHRHIVSCFVGLIVFQAISDCAVTRAGGELVKTDLFVGGQDGYHTYRIPALAMTNSGTLLAFCEGREKSPADHGAIHTLLKRSADNGRTWSKQQLIWKDGDNTCGNPCVVVDRETGTIWLLMTWNHGMDKEQFIIDQKSKDTRRVFVTCSTDDGQTWSMPKEITDTTKKNDWTWYATGPGNGIQLTRGPHKGRLVVPCDHQRSSTNEYYSHVIYSDDHGKTWLLGGSSTRDKTNECAVVELADGRLMLNMRNYLPWKDWRKMPRQVCYSDDGGITWTDQHADETLTEPICQASMIRYCWPDEAEDGRGRILFCNPASQSRIREKVTVRMSYDEGRTWPVSMLIQEGQSGYSSLVALPNGEILCAFEYGKNTSVGNIALARFSFDSPDAAPDCR